MTLAIDVDAKGLAPSRSGRHVAGREIPCLPRGQGAHRGPSVAIGATALTRRLIEPNVQIAPVAGYTALILYPDGGIEGPTGGRRSRTQTDRGHHEVRLPTAADAVALGRLVIGLVGFGGDAGAIDKGAQGLSTNRSRRQIVEGDVLACPRRQLANSHPGITLLTAISAGGLVEPQIQPSGLARDAALILNVDRGAERTPGRR